MNLQEFKDIVGIFADKPMPVDIFESTYHSAELKLFLQKIIEKDFFALQKFRIVKGEVDAPIILTDGRALLPDGFFEIESGYYNLNGEKVMINFVSDVEYDRLQSHTIEYPTSKYPIGNIQSNYIRVLPKTVHYIVTNYINYPEKITYATTNTRGFIEFDENNSSEVKWDEANVIFLIQNFLQLIGIIVTQNEVNQKLKNQ
jgi:hypothetical protein